MPSTSDRLKRLRGWFVVYYLFQFVVGTSTAVAVIQPMTASRFFYDGQLHGITTGFVVTLSLVISLFILVIALVLFQQLLQRKNWVRIFMLVIAWLAVISAATSLLSTYAMMSPAGWLARMLPEVNWALVGMMSAVTNLASLAFSVYMIRTLQFDHAVRDEFVSPQNPPQPTF